MRYPDPAVPASLADLFTEMASVADDLAAKAGEVLRTRDVALATELERDDDRMDALHRELFSRIRDDWPHGMASAVDLTLLGRFHERFADHAVSLGRRVVQLVTGEMPLSNR
jgi:phosphate transport system protein